MKTRPFISYGSCLFCCLVATGTILAQNRPISNEDIARMVQASFDEETIIKAIQANDAAFDTSVEALIALKDVGLSEKVIVVMLESARASKDLTTRGVSLRLHCPKRHHRTWPIPREFLEWSGEFGNLLLTQ